MIKTVEKSAVSLTLKQFGSIAAFRHLKRVRPVQNGQKLQILIGEETMPVESEMELVPVPSRAPLSRFEWTRSNSIWPLSLPNVIETTALMEGKYFSQSQLLSRSSIVERVTILARQNYTKEHGPCQAAVLAKENSDGVRVDISSNFYLNIKIK